ncbi:hypothetical protein LCGC14_1365430 [marine sediment metagenome]|uniref:Transmembrane protein n=1 Tax=marine sediment metagenome TaxID=412755 RepID=A0A0F9MM27_9ZZZZ|nr:hypothetical protein [Methylophaga sp.]HEC59115.1 hypothetical protein [Methylophaga sp.]
MPLRILRWMGIAGLLIAYAVLAHYTNQSVHNGHLGALVAITPTAFILLVASKQSIWRFSLMLIVLTIALWFGWATLTNNFWYVYWLQDAGLQFALFVTFGRTLIANRQPLCTRFAEMVHSGSLSPQHYVYTRQITFAWTLFFALMTIISTLLFFFAPLTTWSLFANFLTLPLIALMFIVEYGVRIWVLPDSRQNNIFDAIKAYKNDPERRF